MTEKDVELVGQKVKDYAVIHCSSCNKSFRLDFYDIYSALEKLGGYYPLMICPWCDHSERYNPYFIPQHQVVLDE